MVRRQRLTPALAGAITAVGLSFLPFSTLAGGALAGYVEGTNSRGAFVAGTLSGLVLLLPATILAWLAGAIVVFGFDLVVLPAGDATGVAIFFGVLFVLVFCYTVVLGALGGLVGAILATSYPDRRHAVRSRLGLEEPPVDGTVPGGETPAETVL